VSYLGYHKWRDDTVKVTMLLVHYFGL